MYNLGCHACGRVGCWTGSTTCFAKCSRVRHVCTSVTDGSGCTSCDKPCHATNVDPLCTFFRRARGCVAWSTNAQQLLDTDAGTQGSVPHMSQVPWTFTNTSGTQVLVDGVAYRKGYGFPGDSDNEEFNNCLIDSLRQCLRDLQCDRKLVRRDLQDEFGCINGQDHRRQVTHSSYLDVECHWQAILRSFERHSSSDQIGTFDPNDYCVVALRGDRPGHGTVLGNFHAPIRLVIINWGDVHFDPCLPQ